jgi:hypothetical protein
MSSDIPNTEHPDPSKEGRDGFRLQCNAGDCSSSFTGEDLQSIFRSAARHWNKEHGNILSSSHRYEAIDEVEYGGHHIQGNAYEVRKYDVYITSFDVARELGQIDGLLVAGNAACSECYCYIPDRDDRIEDEPEDSFDEEWTCAVCLEEQKIERRASENASLTGWETKG